MIDNHRRFAIGEAPGGRMLYLPNYASTLRCIGQALQSHNIEVFELRTDANEFRVQGADPNPPYTGLIELHFSLDSITILDREGQARRHQSKSEFRFDSLPEILRAVGAYIDNKHAARLRRLNNSCLSDDAEIEIEYQTRGGDIRTETLSMNVIRETAVDMYKRRTRLSNPISILTR
jgi:hypothetical protein